jgi:sortase B
MKAAFRKKTGRLAAIVMMGISAAGMAFFYYREREVSEKYRETAEAARASAVPVQVSSMVSPADRMEESSRKPVWYGRSEKEMPKKAAGEITGKKAGEEENGTEAGKNQEWRISYDWDALLSVNGETAGWLCLPGSLIDFPVVDASDNSFYLSHGFDREKSSAGCLFMDKDTCQDDFNRVIYGHNMGTGSKAVFSTLIRFGEEEYFRSSPVFYYTERYGITETYDVMAVVEYDVKDTGEWDFRTRNHGAMEDYNRWFEQLEGRACFYREPEKAPDKILTLATCDRRKHGKDGRLLVIGALREPAERRGSGQTYDRGSSPDAVTSAGS